MPDSEFGPPKSSGSPGERAWAFIRIMNVRLRFIFLMVLVGLLVGYWEHITNYYDRWTRPSSTASSVQDKNTECYCPMDPQIVRDEPGKCPICGMPLSERPKGEKKPLPEGVLAQVRLSPQRVEIGRIQTSPVQYRLLSRKIRAIGQIDPVDRNRTPVVAQINGQVHKLLVTYSGRKVTKGEPLLEIFSPDLRAAEEGLLRVAKAAREQQPTTSPAVTSQAARDLLTGIRRKLMNWGMSESQIDEVIKRGTPSDHMTVCSPVDGTVIDKPAVEGQTIMPNLVLYTLADLSKVWMQAKLFAADMTGVREGQAVEIRSPVWPNEIFVGSIASISYWVDPDTQTVDARIQIDNPDSKLMPGLNAHAVISLPVGRMTELEPTSTAAAEPSVGTKPLADAYLRLLTSYAQDKADADALSALIRAAQSVGERGETSVKQPSAAIADMASGLQGKDLAEQRKLLKALSEKMLSFLKSHPPSGESLYLVYCPMVDANWASTSRVIANPYYGSEMLRCGRVTGRIETTAVKDEGSFATGYYCPVYPDQLFGTPQQCPVDEFPMKYVKIEKVLAVPQESVIDTGTRKVVYRESAPGVFDMVEVTLGNRAGDFYPLVTGLNENDRVATQGAFLVDAENRLNPAVTVQYLGGSGGPQKH